MKQLSSSADYSQGRGRSWFTALPSTVHRTAIRSYPLSWMYLESGS